MNNDSEPKDSILGILRAAIDIENFGIRYYNALSSAVSNTCGKSFLNYLATAEEKHKMMLENLYNKQKELGDEVKRPLPLDNLDEEGKLAVFSEPLDEVDPTDIDAIEAVTYGIHVEEKSKIFYENAAKIVDDFDLKETFNRLVEFENEHLKLLQSNLETLQISGDWSGI
jgi:rubrerythrin